MTGLRDKVALVTGWVRVKLGQLPLKQARKASWAEVLIKRTKLESDE